MSNTDPAREEEVKKPTIEVEKEKTDEQVAIEKEGSTSGGDQYDRQEIEKMHKRMEFQARQFERGLKKLDETLRYLSSPKEPQEQQEPDQLDEIDAIAQKNWKEAVRLLGRQSAEEYFSEYQKKQEDLKKQLETQTVLQQSKSKVFEKYPDIEDEDSDTSKIYRQVINENPQFLKNPYGPVLAMYEMENKMRQNGIMPPDIKNTVQAETQKEVLRRTRVGGAHLPKGRGSSPERIVLAQSEVDYCKQNGIKPEDYVATREKLMSSKEGVSVE